MVVEKKNKEIGSLLILIENFWAWGHKVMDWLALFCCSVDQCGGCHTNTRSRSQSADTDTQASYSIELLYSSRHGKFTCFSSYHNYISIYSRGKVKNRQFPTNDSKAKCAKCAVKRTKINEIKHERVQVKVWNKKVPKKFVVFISIIN